MNKQIKNNKRKVWRKTYGKVFARRNAFLYAQMAVSAATSSARISSLALSGCPAGLCMANHVLAATQHMMNISKQMNSGKVTKQKIIKSPN
tara:strand:- start:50 stop:322 length:273 start_codon:yes stop_codon:yes gene_type:complete